MTNSPRLDSLTIAGTDHIPARIRLADGHLLTVTARPNAHEHEIEEVFLFPGLTAPDAGGWENEDHVELLLTGDHRGELYLDVPVQAVRDLIEQHGGEHEDKDDARSSN